MPPVGLLRLQTLTNLYKISSKSRWLRQLSYHFKSQPQRCLTNQLLCETPRIGTLTLLIFRPLTYLSPSISHPVHILTNQYKYPKITQSNLPDLFLILHHPLQNPRIHRDKVPLLSMDAALIQKLKKKFLILAVIFSQDDPTESIHQVLLILDVLIFAVDDY